MFLKGKRQFIEYMAIVFIGVILTALAISHLPVIQGGISKFFSILMPFYIGFGIAYVLNRPITFFEKRFKLARKWGITLTYLSLLLLITLFLSLLLPKIAENSVKLVTDITRWVSSQSFDLTEYNLGPIQNIVQSNLNKLTEILSTLSNFLVENITNLLFAVTATLMQIIIGIIISIYMLADKEMMINLGITITNAFFSKALAKKITRFASNVNEVFSHFITGLLVEAIIVGILAFIGMSIMGIRYAPILALIICFTNVIPYVGPFIGAVPAVVATLTYSPLQALWVLGFILVLQQFDGNFIGPRVMGNYIGLAPIWIILSITIGGGFGGILGVILAIPTGAIIKIVGTELVEKQVEKRKKGHSI